MVLEVYLFPGLQKIRNLILFVICETIFIPWKISLTYAISLLVFSLSGGTETGRSS